MANRPLLIDIGGLSCGCTGPALESLAKAMSGEDDAGPDIWALPCPRALDHTPPGDWTLAFQRDDTGRLTGVEVGCWLARRLPYARLG